MPLIIKAMKIRIILACIVYGTLAQGQVGIGTQTPDPSSSLEILSTNKGILTPRITTLEMNSIVSPATGLWAYNTEIQGFLGYNGSQWTQDIFYPTDLWDFKGNTGNVAGNYIGTSNNISFNIRTNNNPIISFLPNRQVRLNGNDITSSRAFILPAQQDTSYPSIYASNSNGFGATPFAVTTVATNIGGGSVLGTYAFANSIVDAEAGISAAGFSYIQDTAVSGISFYTNGHPTNIDDRSKEVMIVTEARNVGIGTHNPQSKLQIAGGDLYIANPNNGLIIRDASNNCRRITVNDTGTLDVSAVITCP